MGTPVHLRACCATGFTNWGEEITSRTNKDYRKCQFLRQYTYNWHVYKCNSTAFTFIVYEQFVPSICACTGDEGCLISHVNRLKIANRRPLFLSSTNSVYVYRRSACFVWRKNNTNTNNDNNRPKWKEVTLGLVYIFECSTLVGVLYFWSTKMHIH